MTTWNPKADFLRLIPRLLLFLLIAYSGTAQPLQRNAIVLRVDAEQVVRNETQWRSGWGDFSRDMINSRVLVIALRQLGAGDPLIKVKWYFIGRDFDQQRLFIYDSAEVEGRILPGGIRLAATSKELVLTREQASNLGVDRASGDVVLRTTRTTSGKQPWGWAVFVEQGGLPLAEQASVPEFIEWTRKTLAETSEKPPEKSKRKPQFVPLATNSKRGG